MTDQELIKALRYCGGDDELACKYCPVIQECHQRTGIPVAELAADRLEALLAEVAEMEVEVQKQICKRSESEREIGRLEEECDHFRDLTKMVPQWVSVSERLPENSDKQVLAVVSGFYDGMYFHDALEIAEFPWDEGWILEAYPEWENPNVTYWCYLPEPPSTEDSPTGQKG